MKEDSRKLPAIQFYPGDWKKDLGVQALSFHDRGVWFEILLLMHESKERGRLILNGQAMPEEVIARLLGLDKQILTTTLTTLVTYGVASREPQTGILYSRRMMRDEEIRKLRSEAGKLGGNPGLLKQKSTTGVKQNPTPSSSSSISSSSSEYINTSATDVAAVEEPPSQEKNRISAQQREWFEKWWKRYWTKRDKQPAWKAFQKYIRTPEQLSDMLKAFERDLGMMLKRDPEMRPYGATWLNKEPWQDGNQLFEIPKVQKTAVIFRDRAFEQVNRDLPQAPQEELSPERIRELQKQAEHDPDPQVRKLAQILLQGVA